MERINNYLDKRGVRDANYRKCFLDAFSAERIYPMCSVGKFDFAVSRLFDGSDRAGYGLIISNEVLQMDKGSYMAIGLIEGDDVICMDLKNGNIMLWMIQTGEGEFVKIFDSFEKFWKMCGAVAK